MTRTCLPPFGQRPSCYAAPSTGVAWTPTTAPCGAALAAAYGVQEGPLSDAVPLVRQLDSACQNATAAVRSACLGAARGLHKATQMRCEEVWHEPSLVALPARFHASCGSVCRRHARRCRAPTSSPFSARPTGRSRTARRCRTSRLCQRRAPMLRQKATMSTSRRRRHRRRRRRRRGACRSRGWRAMRTRCGELRRAWLWPLRRQRWRFNACCTAATMVRFCGALCRAGSGRGGTSFRGGWGVRRRGGWGVCQGVGELRRTGQHVAQTRTPCVCHNTSAISGCAALAWRTGGSAACG